MADEVGRHPKGSGHSSETEPVVSAQRASVPDAGISLRRLSSDEADEASFYVDDFGDGRSLTQHRYYLLGGDTIVAIGELNLPNHWHDEHFEARCRAFEAAFSFEGQS